jgi:hypothetical protein
MSWSFPVAYKRCPKCTKALTKVAWEGHSCLKAKPVYLVLCVIRGGLSRPR